MWQGRVMTWSVDGPTGWLDGRLQSYHKSFDGFRGAIIFMAAVSCWDHTLMTACSDGIVCCLDILNGSCCTEINIQALSRVPHDPLGGGVQTLQAHSCTLNTAGDGLLWLQDGELCQLQVESGQPSSMRLPKAADRLAALQDGTRAIVGLEDGLVVYKLPAL